jgi:hypothetical protein
MTSEELLVIFTALAIGGFVKGLTGVGLPLIAVPVMAGFLGVERAVITMVIPSIVLNLYQTWKHREHVVAVPELPRLLVAGVPGAAFGATVLYLASERFLATSLAIWVVSYVILRIAHPQLKLSIQARMLWSPAVGAVAGALQAATGISAPVIAAYADALGLEPRSYVFAVSAAFAAFSIAHFALLVLFALYTRELFLQSLLAVLPGIAFIPLGDWARRFIRPRLFDLMIRALLIAMALRLVYAAWLSS